MASVYIYWVSTTLLCLLYLTSGYIYATKGDWVRKALADLGYPAYLVPFMIVVKIVGPVAIVSRFNVALSDLPMPASSITSCCQEWRTSVRAVSRVLCRQPWA
jgi:hypothetical protein